MVSPLAVGLFEVLVWWSCSRQWASVAENSAPGTFVAYVSVDDADSGDNGRFSCAVTTAGERFALRQTFPPGEFQLVTAAAPLDRERRAGYDVIGYGLSLWTGTMPGIRLYGTVLSKVLRPARHKIGHFGDVGITL